MGQAGSTKKRDSGAPPEAAGALASSSTRNRIEISVRGPEDNSLAPLTKLVSHIPPAPRLPKVDGMNLIASTVSSDDTDDPGHDAGQASAPRFIVRQRAREVDAAQAWGAVVAAILLGALILWASSN